MKLFKSICYALALLSCPALFCSAPAQAPTQTPEGPATLQSGPDMKNDPKMAHVLNLIRLYDEAKAQAQASREYLLNPTLPNDAKHIIGIYGTLAQQQNNFQTQVALHQLINLNNEESQASSQLQSDPASVCSTPSSLATLRQSSGVNTSFAHPECFAEQNVSKDGGQATATSATSK